MVKFLFLPFKCYTCEWMFIHVPAECGYECWCEWTLCASFQVYVRVFPSTCLRDSRTVVGWVQILSKKQVSLIQIAWIQGCDIFLANIACVLVLDLWASTVTFRDYMSSTSMKVLYCIPCFVITFQCKLFYFSFWRNEWMSRAMEYS